jgi:lipopolysaccharide biosynthesis regulator YciM
VKIYEEQNNWKKAFAVFNQLKESTATKGKLRLAMYKVREGMALTKVDEEKSARALFKDAIKIDTSCAPAYIYLGDSYWRENRKSDAINTWTDLIKKNPQKAYLAFQRLEKAWFEKGQFSKIEELYQGLISADEQNVYARIALADIYRKKGEYKQSLKLLEDMTKYEQYSDIVEQELVKVLMDQSKYEEASKKALELIEKKTKPFHDKLKAELDQLEQS